MPDPLDIATPEARAELRRLHEQWLVRYGPSADPTSARDARTIVALLDAYESALAVIEQKERVISMYATSLDAAAKHRAELMRELAELRAVGEAS